MHNKLSCLWALSEYLWLYAQLHVYMSPHPTSLLYNNEFWHANAKKALQAVALWWTEKSWKPEISILDLEGCGDGVADYGDLESCGDGVANYGDLEGCGDGVADVGKKQLKANYEEGAHDK